MAYELESVRTQGMGLTILSDGLAIPITLTEVKQHLSIDFNDQDVYLTSLLESAFREIELFTQKSLKTKSVKQSYKEINGYVQLAYTPVQSITSVKTLSDIDLGYTTNGDKSKIYAYSKDGIVITYVAGYTTLPADIKNSILDVVAIDFDNKVEDKRLALKEVKERLRHYRPVYV